MHDLSRLPDPAQKHIAIRVKPAAERAIRNGHPWVYADAITRQSHLGGPGDLAVIFDRNKRRFLAVGLYDPLSPIRIKILQREQPQRINQAWFRQRLNQAQSRRQALIDAGATGYRLVYGESDGFPALVIDRYGATLVLKLYASAWLPHLKHLIAALRAEIAFDRLVLRLSRAIQAGQQNIARLYGLTDGLVLLGDEPRDPVSFVENGVTFAADVRQGHKTGFFFDQRDNRQIVRGLASGRRILDVFAYSGGFSVYALAGGAKSALALDSSEAALAQLKPTLAANGLDAKRADTISGDAFATLKALIEARRKFSLVIVDPPSLANSRANVDRAKAAYRRLVEMSLALMTEDGALMMASCSARITEGAFTDLILRAARDAGYALDIMETTGHALDHPIGFPEAAYLKAVFARLRS